MRAYISKLLPTVAVFTNSILYYGLIIFGGVLFAYGWWLVYPPVGYMVLAILIVLATLDSRR